MTSSIRPSLVGVSLGAALMFLLDPSGGRRRRALLRDKLVRTAHTARHAWDARRSDVTDRWQGVQALIRAKRNASDRVIAERVRAEVGQVVSHPRAVSVSARRGSVTLGGHVLATEAGALLAAIENVRGVREVRNELTRHVSADGMPLQTSLPAQHDQWSSWVERCWSPVPLTLAGATAVFAAGLTFARKGR
jgi:hypothetical protein